MGSKPHDNIIFKETSMTPEQKMQLEKIREQALAIQKQLASMKGAPTMESVMEALARNPDIKKYSQSAVEDIVGAYLTGDWSGVTDLTGVPFTPEQQKAAVAEAERVLAPAYKAQESYDRSITEDMLRRNQQGFADFQRDEKKAFGEEKDALDQDAADRGVLFSGARAQKLRDLRNTYEDREALMRRNVAESTGATARAYQYDYGNEAAEGLSDLYALPGESRFNPNVAGGKVTSGRTLSSVYSPGKYSFQGTQPVAQKAAVQTRAATQLANRANKLTLSGYLNKF
jgi:hypothetical protein